MLAYLFWHRPRVGEQAAAYESLVGAFHRSLAHTPPAGMIASASYRLAGLPWRAPAATEDPAAKELEAMESRLAVPAYEDWYLVEDFAALGVLNEAAVGRGHRTSHDDAARRSGAGAGGVYALLEGEAVKSSLAEATLAVWAAPPPAGAAHEPASGVEELLADGIKPGHGSLWRRQLVLGPAPEYCVLGSEVPSGVAPTRLPAGWTATVTSHEVLFGG